MDDRVQGVFGFTEKRTKISTGGKLSMVRVLDFIDAAWVVHLMHQSPIANLLPMAKANRPL